jgi:hypothetical protein
LDADIPYEIPHQPPAVGLECFPDGGVMLTVRPPAVVALLPHWLTPWRKEPLVIGVSPRSLYVANPRRWVMRRRFYRHDELNDLLVTRNEVRGRHVYQLELHVRFEWPLVVLKKVARGNCCGSVISFAPP